jgi:hypothetical protein
VRGRAVKRAGFGAVFLAVLVLTGCHSSSPKRPQGTTEGFLTGEAQPCVGVEVTPGGYQKLSVTVYLTQGSRPVARQTVTGAHMYRFKVSAGSYTVATHEGGGSKPANAVVYAGHTTQANIPSYCM